MYWQLENLFFENEAEYYTAFCVWKPKYTKLEYKVNIQDLIRSVGYGRRWDRIELGMLYSWLCEDFRAFYNNTIRGMIETYCVTWILVAV